MTAPRHERARAAAAPELRPLEGVDLRQLRLVTEIIGAGCFSGAARRLGVSQPTLSKSIARLEAQLGVRLFDRDGQGARPTPHAQLLAMRGGLLLHGAEELWRELASLSEETGRIRIGVGPATRVKPLPQLVRALRLRFPDLQVETRQEEAANLMRAVEEGRFDLVLAYCEGAEAYEDLLRVKIFEDRQVIVVRPLHPIAAVRGPISVSALMEHPWASWGLTPSFAAWAGDLSSPQTRRATAITSDDFHVIEELATTADYIARGPRFLFRSALETGALVELETSYASTYECWMLTTRRRWRSPLGKAVASLAKSVSLID